MRTDLAAFDDLPNSAVVPISVVSAVTGEAVSTLWKKAKTEPLLKPIVLGHGSTRFNVGKLRQYLAGEAAKPDKPTMASIARRALAAARAEA